MKRIITMLLLCCLMAINLTGCLVRSPEDLYTLPELSADYANLQDALEDLTRAGWVYAAPVGGSHTQPIQFQDLNRDGVDEAVAYFRDPQGSSPIMICIFEKNAAELYRKTAEIRGEGTAIQSVAYVELDDSPTLELVVNYQISDQVYSLHTYSLAKGAVTELLSSGCARYETADLDGDDRWELVLFQMDDAGGKRAEYYDWSDGTLAKKNVAFLSGGLVSISRAKISTLADGEPAIYVTGEYGLREDRLITDILSVSDGELKNITLNGETGSSDATVRSDTGDIFATDINDDGTCEIPFAAEMTHLGAGSVWMVRWMQYHQSGEETLACTTVWAPLEGWYLEVPQEWNGAVSAQRTESSVRSEISTVFYQLAPSVSGDVAAAPFLTIYTSSVSLQGNQSGQGSRFVLSNISDQVCTALLTDTAEGMGLDQAAVKSMFHRIPNDWSD